MELPTHALRLLLALLVQLLRLLPLLWLLLRLLTLLWLLLIVAVLSGGAAGAVDHHMRISATRHGGPFCRPNKSDCAIVL